MSWIKRFFLELIKPENIAKEFTLAIIVLIFTLSITFIFTFLITPKPDVNVYCNDYDNFRLITARNEGDKSAYNIEVRADSNSPCSFGMGVGYTNYKGNEFFNVTIAPQKNAPFNYETLTGGSILAPGDSFSFYCPENTIFRLKVSGENFGEVIETCR